MKPIKTSIDNEIVILFNKQLDLLLLRITFYYFLKLKHLRLIISKNRDWKKLKNLKSIMKDFIIVEFYLNSTFRHSLIT